MSNSKKRSSRSSKEIPEEWVQLFFEKVDLQAAFDCLEGVRGFYAEGLRGHTRSLQLRFDDAWAHFRRASALARREAKTRRDLQRRVAVAILQVSAALSECPLDEEEAEWIRQRADSSDGVDRWLPPEMSPTLSAHAMGRAVMNLRFETEGALLLHANEPSKALWIFEHLRELQEGKTNSSLVSSYVGAGAAYYNLGDREEALRQLENAGWTLQVGEISNLSRVRGGCVLSALYRYLELDDEAEQWERFAANVCPNSTSLELFRQREQMIVERCSLSGALVFL